jgi:hypothetical protein
MGTSPAIGRTFTADEDRPGNDRVIVLSHRLWLRRFGANASVVHRPVRMNGVNYIVIGVMPESFDLTADAEEAQLWAPIAFTPAQKVLHDEHYLTVYGRLKADASIERARAELEAVAVRVRHDFPKDAKNLVYGMQPFREQFVGDYRARLLVLMGAVGIVLLIACGNVANLLLARGAGRAREIALRAALGAGRWRIVRQLLTESVALALIAAGAGLVLAQWFITAVVDNDSGGIFTYSAAGAQFGYLPLWTLMPITLLLIITQEMCSRMGAVTGKGLSDLIREEYGLRITFLMMLGLVITNFGNVVTETNASNGDRFKFAGMQYDSTVGQYYDHARWYGSGFGRFLGQTSARSSMMTTIFVSTGNNRDKVFAVKLPFSSRLMIRSPNSLCSGSTILAIFCA